MHFTGGEKCDSDSFINSCSIPSNLFDYIEVII